ncbi:MAG: RraA family protein, partial [Desulfitobacteriaceae bacterium]|nr:RraA family protein [Desulfitobacteriaceae bacterium]
MPVGSRIYMRRNMPPKEILEGFKNIPTANIADCMGRLYAMSSRIRLMTAPSEANMVGVALTVKAPP